MIKINGNYAEAIIYSNEIDSGSEGLIKALCNCIIAEKSKIRVMPDAHPGKGCAVGMTMTLNERVAPGLVGVDIGCGMEVIKVKPKRLELQQLDKVVQSKIPSGVKIRTALHRFAEIESFSTIHNYIDVENKILRKGAISAQEGEKIIVPLNMRDGCLICKGRGNEEYNYSAPHGAGRLLSRADAKVAIDLEDYEKAMEGIYTTSVNYSTIDESPFAYKPIESILDNIQDTVEVVKIIKPVYNYKCCD